MACDDDDDDDDNHHCTKEDVPQVDELYQEGEAKVKDELQAMIDHDDNNDLTLWPEDHDDDDDDGEQSNLASQWLVGLFFRVFSCTKAHHSEVEKC